MDVYTKIMEYFGYRNQMKKLNEECYEFLEAVDNYEDLDIMGFDKKDANAAVSRDFVIEEMADMLVIITQFLVRYNITQEELDKVMDYKINRTLDRIDEKYYNNDKN